MHTVCVRIQSSYCDRRILECKHCLVFILVMNKVQLGRLVATIKHSGQEVMVIMLM